MKYTVRKIQNGDFEQDFYTYFCEKCGIELPECDPQFIQNEGKGDEKHYCGDCAFKEGLITGEELKKHYYFWDNTSTFKNHYSPIVLENEVIFIKNSDYKKIKKECIKLIRGKND